MKPLLATFFLFLLTYSLFFDEKEETNAQESVMQTSLNADFVTMEQEDYEIFYAKIFRDKGDTLTKSQSLEDYFVKK